jgi:hypothetical protein
MWFVIGSPLVLALAYAMSRRGAGTAMLSGVLNAMIAIAVAVFLVLTFHR